LFLWSALSRFTGPPATSRNEFIFERSFLSYLKRPVVIFVRNGRQAYFFDGGAISALREQNFFSNSAANMLTGVARNPTAVESATKSTTSPMPWFSPVKMMNLVERRLVRISLLRIDGECLQSAHERSSSGETQQAWQWSWSSTIMPEPRIRPKGPDSGLGMVTARWSVLGSKFSVVAMLPSVKISRSQHLRWIALERFRIWPEASTGPFAVIRRSVETFY
jgi:hypothetical protein